MAISYSTNLGLALPAQGDWVGTWGTNQNNFITEYIDSAVAGAQTISGAQTAVTLSTANGTALTQVGGVGLTGSAQYQIINCTGNPASTLVVTVPNTSKTYLVINATSTNQVVTVKAAATTGVSVPAGKASLIVWSGLDFITAASNDISQFTGILPTSKGGTNLGGATPFTANGVLYASSASALATNVNFTYDGTYFSVGASGAIAGSRINPRVFTTTTTASLTPDVQSYDQYNITAQTGGLAIQAPIGTPVDGTKLLLRILDNGGAASLSWNAIYRAFGTALPATTTPTKTTYFGCIYNAHNLTWDVVAATTQT